jgi:hypothetical protein
VPAYYSPKGLFISKALDSTDSVRFSKFERFELLMNTRKKRFCGCSRAGESLRFSKNQRKLLRGLHRRLCLTATPPAVRVLVTTSVIARQAYEEVREDRHPIISLSGKDIADILVANGFSTAATVRTLLETEFSLAPS